MKTASRLSGFLTICAWMPLAAVLLLPLSSCTQVTPKAAVSKDAAPRNAPPAHVVFEALRGGKPPMRLYKVKLDLVNRNDYPTWFVMRFYGDVPLPKNDKVVAAPGESIEFGIGVLSDAERSKVYDRDNARTRDVECYGTSTSDGGFIALRLQPHAELPIDDCRIEAWAPITEMEIWETADITLNGNIPLQNWLATRIEAPEGYYATLNDISRDPKDPSHVRGGRPVQPVDFVNSVEFTHVRKWLVPIIGIGHAPKNPWQ